ncbi:MAG: heat shock protein DnaJ [Ramlibacter sp.]|nr:heat shock protein DnaJ [Ramlibacter sp.]
MKRHRTQNHYEILRLDPHATPQRVRLAYRRMAQKFHPDKYQGKGDSANLMAQINLAYGVLSDPVQRAAYDQSLAGSRPQARSRGAAMAAFVQDRIGWAGWLLFGVASIAVLTLGFVLLKTVAPPQPTFRAPASTSPTAPVADATPLAPVPAIQPWTEPVRKVVPVNEATEPVARLIREGVVSKPQSRP